MDDCDSKEGPELWPSRHLAGRGEEVGRGKLSEVAGMLGSMLQRGVFPPTTKKGKTWLHSAANDVQEEGIVFQGSRTDL